ncbi:MAG: DUF1800 domain-containing protein [Thermoanaerobaculia bacterium]
MNRTKQFLGAVATLALLTGAAPEQKLTERQRVLHAMNRLSFGPRPGDVEAVLKDGLDVWINQQLHPDQLPDRAMEARLASMSTLRMSSNEIIQKFYRPLQEARQQAKRAAGNAPPDGMKGDEKMDAAELRRELRKNTPPDARPQRVMEELQSQRILRAVESDRQLNEVMVDFWMNHFNVFAGKGIDRFLLTSYERDTVRPRVWGRFEDLLMATAKSPAMLFYLDNARSVAAPENRPQISQREDGGMRRRGGLGTRGRANVMSEEPMMAGKPKNPKATRGGLNENYAREIMELHTLGVDAGYTQKDVTELARVLTGWTIAGGRKGIEGSGFLYRPQLHDSAAKTVLGVRFAPGGGMEEGEKMIRLLAHHPATARHIATRLCQRLVADEPPPALVDRVAKRFLDTDGDLRQTVKAVIDGPEFWDPRASRSKVKSPFEYAVSAVRAIRATVNNPIPIARALQQIGEPLYGAQPPTGYSDKADGWINTGALLNRLNFALALASNKLPGVHADVLSLIPAVEAADPSRSVDALAVVLTGGSLSEETKSTIKARIVEQKSPSEDPRDNTQLPTITGLILGSPEFQKQ